MPELLAESPNIKVQLLNAFSDGTFGPPRTVSILHQAATGIATADFDGDGTPDIVVATSSGAALLLNDGTWGSGPRTGSSGFVNGSSADGIASVALARMLHGLGHALTAQSSPYLAEEAFAESRSLRQAAGLPPFALNEPTL